FVDAVVATLYKPVEDTPYISGGRTRAWDATARVRVEAFDELSFDAPSATLDGHLERVSQAAANIAFHVGCAAGEIEAIRVAGKLHDIGKADPRFQRWLGADGQSDGPMAKSGTPRHRIEAARVAAGWPRGGRHELLSAHLISAWLDPDDQVPWHADLVLHLVMTHHGQGRPTTRVVEDANPPSATATVEGTPVRISGDLSIMDWDQPRRFRYLCERYGYWGLALLESILRQADQAVSSATEVV
nr:CRISPR-associated endonuclease Cas3'' [Actinomycetota bacterium]